MENLSDSENDVSIEEEEVQPIDDETEWKLNSKDKKKFWNKIVLPNLLYPPTLCFDGNKFSIYFYIFKKSLNYI